MFQEKLNREKSFSESFMSSMHSSALQSDGEIAERFQNLDSFCQNESVVTGKMIL